MPRGAKKRKAAKKKLPNNHSSSSNPLIHENEEDMNRHDEKQSGAARVEGEFTFGEGGNSNGISVSARESHNGRSSCSSDSSDEEVIGSENSLPSATEVVSHAAGLVEAFRGIRVEEVENTPSDDSEKAPLLVERVKSESLLEVEGDENKLSLVATSEETNKDEGIVQSDNQALTEALLVPEKKTSWRSCCGLFELFSGSGR